MNDRRKERVKSQAPMLPQVDVAVLKELAKKAQGLPPGQGMNMILGELEKIDPKLAKLSEDAPYAKTRRASQAFSEGDKPKVTTAEIKAAVANTNTSQPARRSQREERKKEIEKKPSDEVMSPVQLRKNPLQVTPAARKKGHGSTPMTPVKTDRSIQVTEAAKKKHSKFIERRRYEATVRDDSAGLKKFETENIGDLLEPKPYFDFGNYRQLNSLALRIQGTVALPEVVLVGMSGTGKSELLEAIVGHPINLVGYKENGQTKRPLFVQLNCSTQCDKPRTHIQFDSIHRSEVVQPYAIAENITKHTDAEFSADPISVQFDYAQCFNFAIIDTPGLPFDVKSDEFLQIHSFLAEVLRPPHRLIICVEDADQKNSDNSGGTDTLRGLLKKIDPQSSRTIWVHNKLNSFIDGLVSQTELSQYFQQTNTPTSYWTTLLSQKERQSCKDGNEFVTKLNQAIQRDQRQLSILNMESKYESRVGINALRKHVLEWAWGRYFNNEIPRLFKSITQKKVEQERQIRTLEVQMANLNIRGVATQYTSRYLQLTQSILAGTSKGKPSVNGETLKEEIDEQFFSSAEWDLDNKAVPLEKTKLYGGQQFERLFSEFKIVASQIKMTQSDFSGLPSEDDKKYFLTICEAAGSKAESTLVPLIEQLIERTSFIMKRVPIIVESILTAKDTKPNPRYQSNIDNNLFSPIATL